jgi:hypothetical protein
MNVLSHMRRVSTAMERSCLPVLLTLDQTIQGQDQDCFVRLLAREDNGWHSVTAGDLRQTFFKQRLRIYQACAMEY